MLESPITQTDLIIYESFNRCQSLLWRESWGKSEKSRLTGPGHRTISALGAAGSTAPDKDNFGEDGNGDLLRGEGSDIESDRGVDTLQVRRFNAFATQVFTNRGGSATTSDHSKVTNRTIDYVTEADLIVTVSPGDDDDVSGRGEAEGVEGNDKIISDQRDGWIRKLIAGSELRPVIDHSDSEIEKSSGAGESLPNMSTTADDHLERRAGDLEQKPAVQEQGDLSGASNGNLDRVIGHELEGMGRGSLVENRVTK